MCFPRELASTDSKLTPKQHLGRWLFPRLPITRFLFDQIRVELNVLLVRLGNIAVPSRRRLLKKIRQGRDLRANVGCGPFTLSGFVNLDLFTCHPDVVRWDCRRGLPLADGTAVGIRVEHFLEHLEPREEVAAFLRDSLRVLRPGGVLRVIVPDAERYLRAYCRNDLSAFLASCCCTGAPP